MSETTRILIVEDEEMNIDMLSRRLTKAGYDVATAMDGRKALEVLSHGDIDMVLLDQMMPGMSGLEVLHELRANAETRDLPVIMVTAVADGASVAEALDKGADDYVTKPLDFKIALARIRALINRHKSRRQQQMREARYERAMLSGGNVIIECDLASDEVYFSPEWYKMLGYEPDNQVHHRADCMTRVHPEDAAQLMSAMTSCQMPPATEAQPAPTQASFQTEFRIRHADERYRWVSIKGSTTFSAEGVALRQTSFLNDITHKKTHDELTGLPNLLYLEQEFGELRIAAVPFALLVFEIDRFRLIEENLGITGREAFLREVCRRAQTALADYRKITGFELVEMKLARVGLDEFAICIEALKNLDGVGDLCAFLTHSLCTDFVVGGREVVCAIRLGLVPDEPQYTSMHTLIHDARTAIYASRLSSSGNWKLFEPEMRVLHESRMQMELDLRLALQREEFEVYYQSRVDLANGCICGFEALVRWNHPTRGLVPPIEFIPLAEEVGLVHDIGLWVLRASCAQLQRWRAQFVLPDNFEVSVNFSASQCRQPGLVANVDRILKETGLPPSALNLELTESILLEDLNEARTVLQALKGLGVGLKMDDFGTGYSSLKYLCELPFDCLKIDRSFVSDLDTNRDESATMIETILQLARNLQMETVAEGVETASHAEILRKMGCEFGQGYFYSRPLRAADAEVLLESNLHSCPPHRQ